MSPRTRRLPAKAASQNGTNGTTPHDADDLASLFESKTRELKIPDWRVIAKEPVYSKFRIEISSLYSERAREAAQAFADKLRLVNGEVDADDPELQAFIFEQVVACTTRWWQTDREGDGLIVNGKLLDCTPENIRTVYRIPELKRLYDFVKDEVFRTADFFGQRAQPA